MNEIILKVKPEVKKDFEKMVRQLIEGPEPQEARVQMALQWVVGVVENAHRYDWFLPRTPDDASP